MPAYWTNFATAAAGPALACIITNPADVAKTRLNLERELQSTEMSRAVSTRPPCHSRAVRTCEARTYLRRRAAWPRAHYCTRGARSTASGVPYVPWHHSPEVSC